MTMSGEPRASVELGRPTQETFQVLRRDGPRLLGLALILFWLPGTAFQILMIRGAAAGDTHSVKPTLQIAATLALVAAHSAFAAATVKIALDRLSGEHASPQTVVSAIVDAFPIVFTVFLLMRWGALARLFLASPSPLAPGVVLMLVGLGSAVASILKLGFFGVLTPVVAAPFAHAGGRAEPMVRLMKAGRWPLVMVYFGVWGVWGVAALVIAAPFVGNSFAITAATAPTAFGVGQLALLMLPDSMVELGLTVFAAAYYRELCRVHDGLTRSAVAEIFG